MSGRELVLAAALLAGAAGCLHNPDPRPRSMNVVQFDAHGGYAVMRVGAQIVEGELIAIDPVGVWILDATRLTYTQLRQVSELEVHPYDVRVAALMTWGVLGTLSTISHGFFLAISAPTWLVTTGVTAAVHSRTAREIYDGGNWWDLAQWARFPQGMPPGLTEAELRHGRQPPPSIGPPSSIAPAGPAPAAPIGPAPAPAPAPPAAAPPPAPAPSPTSP